MKGTVKETVSWEACQALRVALQRRQLGEDDFLLMEKILSDWERLRGRRSRLNRRAFQPKKPSGDGGETAQDGDGQKDLSTADAPQDDGQKAARVAKGHGRLSQQDYSGAHRVPIPFDRPELGERCPCGRSKLRPHKETHLTLVGRPPIDGFRFELDCRRCDCGEIFRPRATPPEALQRKYDPSAVAMMAILKHWQGMPGFRLQKLQRQLGLPLPDATQADYVRSLAEAIQPVAQALEPLCAQARLFYLDDTGARIITRIKQQRREPKGKRNGSHATGVVAATAHGLIQLYMIGAQHAGENLDRLLSLRVAGSPPPMVMGDGSPCNTRHDHNVKQLNCLFHARQYFTEAELSFPQEAGEALRLISKVYKWERKAKGLDDCRRLAHHKKHSAPLMKQLKGYLQGLIAQRLVEPNSLMGQAIKYTLKRWSGLTGFLRIPGAPLDNNAAERALKRFVLIRKNSLFYKTVQSAAQAGAIMSVIATGVAHGVSPLDYLADLYRYESDVARHPELWLPWNYRERLSQVAGRASPCRDEDHPALGSARQSSEKAAASGLPFHRRILSSLAASSVNA